MKFGCRVAVKGMLDRHTRFRGTRHYDRTWMRRPLIPVQRIYIGYRTLANGTVSYHGGLEDGYTEWKGNEFIKVALVVFNERTNPVYVLFEDVEELH